LAVHSGRSMERGVPTPFHSQRIAHRGACGKTRVVPQNRRPRPEPTDMGVTKCACRCRRTGRAGTSNRWGTRREVASTRRGGAGMCSAGLRGVAGRGRRDPHRRGDGGRNAAARSEMMT
jgi:hypothetical protein